MKKISLVLLTLFAGLIGGLLALRFFSFDYIEKYLLSDKRSDSIPIEFIEKREITIRENEAIVERIEKVERAIIGIRTQTRMAIMTGSGLIVSSDGLVVTLAELVPAGANFSFFVNGQPVAYEVVKRDLENNLALIRVEGNGLPTLEFADFERVKLGERVFLVGAIFDKEGGIVKSVNEGAVKRIEDGIIKTSIQEETMLAGSSLFNIDGKFLGINLVSLTGEIYTIPVSIVKEFIGL